MTSNGKCQFKTTELKGLILKRTLPILLVLINPTYDDTRKRLKGQEARIDQDLDSDYEPLGPINTPTTYTVKLDQRYIDPLTGDYVEGEITMEPASGRILLIKPSI